MADTLGRIVKRVLAGTGGGSDPFTDYRALGSAAGHLWLLSDLTHLIREASCRRLCSHQGYQGSKGIYAIAPQGAAFNTAPNVGNIDWRSPIDGTGAATGRANLRLGSHWLVRYGAQSQWPKIRCTFKALIAAPDTLGFVFVASPGRDTEPRGYDGTPPASGGRPLVATTTTSATLTRITLDLQLEDQDVQTEVIPISYGNTASGVPAIAETVTLGLVSLWWGAYCTSGAPANAGQASGITVYLVPP